MDRTSCSSRTQATPKHAVPKHAAWKRTVPVLLCLLGCASPEAEAPGASAPTQGAIAAAPADAAATPATPAPPNRFAFCDGTGVDLDAAPDLEGAGADYSTARAVSGTWINAEVAGIAGPYCSGQPAVLIRAGFELPITDTPGFGSEFSGAALMRFTCADAGSRDRIVRLSYDRTAQRQGRFLSVEQNAPAHSALIWPEGDRLRWILQTPDGVCLHGRADRVG